MYKSKPAFSKLVFKEFLKIATTGIFMIFMYNGRLYCQVDGVTMGSPFGGGGGATISNFCFAHLENELLSLTKFKPELYLRYADDIFGCLEASLYMKSELISMFYWFFFQHHNVLYVVIPLLYKGFFWHFRDFFAFCPILGQFINCSSPKIMF